MYASLTALAVFLVGCAGPAAVSGPRKVDVGGYKLWMQVAGAGDPTVVFEAGGGDDSTVWAKIEPEVRARLKVRTVVYDRAGLGKSDPAPGPYSIDEEAHALDRALDRAGVRGPIVLVAHSYGGFVAMLLAESRTQIAGVVLVDANMPSFFDDAEVARLLAQYEPQFGELEKAAPALARVMIPLMRAYPATARRMRESTIPPSIPVIDITAEKTWVESLDELAAMRRAHESFVAASQVREAVFAEGSGHYVMRDKPEVVLAAIAKMVERVR